MTTTIQRDAAAAEQSGPRPRYSGRSYRVESVDVLRGLLMVLMALGHARDYFSSAAIDPTDPVHSWPALFITRWVTHLCAPGFILLAGAGVYLQRQRKSAATLTRALILRGLWLIVDPIRASALGNWSDVWYILHERGLLTSNAHPIALYGYPVIPWIGVMPLGYCLRRSCHTSSRATSAHFGSARCSQPGLVCPAASHPQLR